MLKTPHLSSYRNAAHIQFNNDLIRICEVSNPDDLKIREQFELFKKGNIEMEEVYKLMQGSALTAKILAEDNLRDNYIIGIEKAADAFTHHFDPAFVEAAHLLLKHIQKYGQKIARMKYQDETAALKDLIDKQRSDEALKAAVILLGLEDWFIKTEESNNRFNDLYIERVKDNAEKPDGSLKDLRKESALHYKELEKHITANSVLNPSELYDTLIKEINLLIDKYNTTRSKSKSDEPDDIAE
jgi:hypothetical protein